MSTQPKRILVVDDEENARIGLSRLLAKEGFHVDSVANGFEALNYLREQEVNLIVTDINMPEMNGISFLKELNRSYPQSNVIMITAYGGVESYIEAMNLGAFEYINKPVKIDELKSILKKIFKDEPPRRAGIGGGRMPNFERILFATDFSENSEHAFTYALSLARQFGSHLTILHVINEPVDLRGFYVPHVSFENLEKEIQEGAEKMLAKFCATHLGDYNRYETLIVTGVPYEEILKRADQEKASLIVLGTQGRSGIDHLLFGSTAERVVRKATCPVVTVRLP